MELAGKVLLGLLYLIVLGLVAGFVDEWWTQRQRDKKKRGRAAAPKAKGEESEKQS